MSLFFRSSTRIITVLSIVAALTIAPAASAGCLDELGDCLNCGQKATIDNMREGDALDAFPPAVVDSLDCTIDLVHCILFGRHHDYECGL